jgi:8-oxo-dGTP pyrophosphatase MutT (NUDIX family)
VSAMTLLQLLERYQPDAGDESAHYAAIVALASGGLAAFDNTRFEPGHVTASAFVVCRTTECALLIFHRRLARWLQPGGHIEPGEIDLRVSAAREVLEETGIALEPDALRVFDVDVHVIPASATAPVHNHYDVRFIAFVDDESGSAGSDAEDLRWISLAALLESEVEPSIQRMTRKARRSLAAFSEA